MLKLRRLANGCVPYVKGYLPYQVKNKENEEGIWDCIDETQAVEYLASLIGQHANTEFGSLIQTVMADSNGPKKWIEVGTWNGNGTTLCMLKGLKQRENKNDVEIVSYEADPFFYKVAKINLEKSEFYDGILSFYDGRLPGSKPFISESEIPESEKKEGSHYHLFYEREKHIYRKAKQIVPPFVADAVILDGGEFTGRFDWDALDTSKLQYIFLDDICNFKHKALYEMLCKDSRWVLWRENKTEVNGWAIFRAPTA